jgi:hypothetical protein
MRLRERARLKRRRNSQFGCLIEPPERIASVTVRAPAIARNVAAESILGIAPMMRSCTTARTERRVQVGRSAGVKTGA